MLLRSSPASPFGRKVKIAAKQLGLLGQIEVVPADTNDPDDPLRDENPLGKLPVLVLDDGTPLYDSPVICAYLDALKGNRLIPAEGEERWKALRLEALGDGIIDAAILQVYEARYRPEEGRHKPWVEYQAAKVDRALAYLEQTVEDFGEKITIGHIAIACALGYLDLRFEGRWRADHPKLSAWLEDFAARVPKFAETAPKE